MDERKSQLREIDIARMLRAAAGVTEKSTGEMGKAWIACVRKHSGRTQRALIEFLVQMAA